MWMLLSHYSYISWNYENNSKHVDIIIYIASSPVVILQY